MVLPLQGFPNAYTAVFDDGMVAYQVTVDIPSIVLKYVFWIDDLDTPTATDA